MAVKEKINPCAQAGAYVSTPGGLKAYVTGVDPKNSDRVLIDYAAKHLGSDSYNPSTLTLIQIDNDNKQPLIIENPAESIIAIAPLDALATEINQLHQQCEEARNVARSAENSALQHAKLCGEKLLQAKRECSHGGWEAWRTEHIQIPSSTATLYQRVADRWDELSESTTVADLTLREASALLKKPRQAALKQSENVTTHAQSVGYGANVSSETARSLSEARLRPCKPSISPEEFNREMWGESVPVVNPRSCQFECNGKDLRGVATGVVVDWVSLEVKAVLIDHSIGQTQVPIKQVTFLNT